MHSYCYFDNRKYITERDNAILITAFQFHVTAKNCGQIDFYLHEP